MALKPIKENEIYAHKPYVIMSPEGQAVNGGRMVLHAGEKAECEKIAETLYSGSDCPVEKREYDLAYNDNTVMEIDQPCTMTYGQVARALANARSAEEEAEAWMNLALISTGSKLYDSRLAEYQTAAQRAIEARLEWLDIRNRFESGE